jgi:hypothetical protein
MARAYLYALDAIEGGGIHTTINTINALVKHIWMACLPSPLFNLRFSSWGWLPFLSLSALKQLLHGDPNLGVIIHFKGKFNCNLY